MDQPSPVPDTEISLTFVKGLEVLRAFENGQTDMTVADIARLVGHTRDGVLPHPPSLFRRKNIYAFLCFTKCTQISKDT